MKINKALKSPTLFFGRLSLIKVKRVKKGGGGGEGWVGGMGGGRGRVRGHRRPFFFDLP